MSSKIKLYVHSSIRTMRNYHDRGETMYSEQVRISLLIPVLLLFRLSLKLTKDCISIGLKSAMLGPPLLNL